MVRLLSAGGTDVGLWRGNNEDAYLVMPEAGVFAISDGMGGEAAGEIASGYFIETVQAIFISRIPVHEETSHAMVQGVFRCSNERIFEHTAQHPDDEGMGCTGDILVFDENRYVIGHVGDSRIYLLRDAALQQLTTDHSLVQFYVDHGMLTREEAKNHPGRNIILRAVGTDSSASFDILQGTGLNRDIFLLCSDGLTDMVDDTFIQDILGSTESLQYKVRNLIGAAMAAGGKDNITVILCEIEIG